MDEAERLFCFNKFLYADARYLLLKELISQRKPPYKEMYCTFVGRRLLEKCETVPCFNLS